MRIAVVAIAVACARVAWADPGEPEPIKLTYSAPAGCPDADAFFAALAARAPAARVDASDVREFRVTFVDDGARTTGTLAVISGDDVTSREVSGATCAETVSALALVAALAVEERASRPAVVIRTGRDPVPPPPPPPVSPSPAPRWRVAVGSGIEVESGVAPGTILGVPVFVRIDRGTDGPGLRVGLTRSEQDDVIMSAGAAAFRWTVGWADACPIARRAGRVSGRACAGVEAGVLEGSGTSVDSPATDQRPWVAARARVAVATRIGPVELELGANGAAPLVRDRFFIAPATTVNHASAVTGGLGLTASVDLR